MIIALGILVAAVVIITSVYATDIGAQSKVKVPEKKVKPAAVLKNVVEKFASHSKF